MLAGEGVFREVRDGEFALTAPGETLQSDSPNWVRASALSLHQRSGQLGGRCGTASRPARPRSSICTGCHSTPSCPGTGKSGYFNGWMTRSSELDNAAVVASYHFSQVRTVVDVGGGRGATLAAILWAYPSVRGVLFDLPSASRMRSSLKSLRWPDVAK